MHLIYIIYFKTCRGGRAHARARSLVFTGRSNELYRPMHVCACVCVAFLVLFIKMPLALGKFKVAHAHKQNTQHVRVRMVWKNHAYADRPANKPYRIYAMYGVRILYFRIHTYNDRVMCVCGVEWRVALGMIGDGPC